MGRVEGKVVLVTGGASGLGEADAEMLVAEGAHVFITDLNEEAGRAVAKRIGATFFAQDVAEEADWERVIGAIVDQHGRLDVLVNNAAVSLTALIEDTTLEQYQFVQRVNSDGVFLGCKHAIPVMSQGGSIINISSGAAVRGYPSVIAYSASKGAVRALTMTVAAHCLSKDLPIRCNAVLPGPHTTPLQQKSAREMATITDRSADPRRRPVGEPVDIANVVLFLASDESRNVSGQEIVVDGGFTVQ